MPTWGAMFVRETVRRTSKRSWDYGVKRAEYFGVNITKSDSDIEDELKDLKDKEKTMMRMTMTMMMKMMKMTMTMNHQLRKEVKVAVLRSHPEEVVVMVAVEVEVGVSDDPGYGKPSEDDIKKLGDIFNKS